MLTRKPLHFHIQKSHFRIPIEGRVVPVGYVCFTFYTEIRDPIAWFKKYLGCTVSKRVSRTRERLSSWSLVQGFGVCLLEDRGPLEPLRRYPISHAQHAQSRWGNGSDETQEAP